MLVNLPEWNIGDVVSRTAVEQLAKSGDFQYKNHIGSTYYYQVDSFLLGLRFNEKVGTYEITKKEQIKR